MTQPIQSNIAILNAFAQTFNLQVEAHNDPDDPLYDDFNGSYYCVKPDSDLYHHGSVAWYNEESGMFYVTIHADHEDPLDDPHSEDEYYLYVKCSPEEMENIIKSGRGPHGRMMNDIIDSWM